MFNDKNVDKRGNDTFCTLTSVKIQECATRFMEGHRTFLGPGKGEKWFRGYDYKPEGRWDSVASEMVGNFWKVKTSRIQRDKRLESWDYAEKERQWHHSLQWRIFKCGALVSNDSLSEPALCLRGNHNWCETLGRTESEKREKSGHELNRRLFKEQKITLKR